MVEISNSENLGCSERLRKKLKTQNCNPSFILEGKRSWKPTFKIREKLSKDNLDVDSENMPSTSYKDFIEPGGVNICKIAPKANEPSFRSKDCRVNLSQKPIHNAKNSGYCQNYKKRQKKAGNYNQPIIVEGERPRKSSFKVQGKLFENNLDIDSDSSVEICSSSTSDMDIGKTEGMQKRVSKIAEKSKKQNFRNNDAIKNISLKSKNEDDTTLSQKEKCELSKKQAAVLLNVLAAEIRKTLTTLWDDHFNQANAGFTKSEKPCVTNAEMSPVSLLENEQEQRVCDNQRTEGIIHVAKSETKRKEAVRKLRQQKSATLSNGQLQVDDFKSRLCTDKQSDMGSPLCLSQGALAVELNKSPVSSKSDDVLTQKACCACGLTTTVSAMQKCYRQLTCSACNRFFEDFIEEPKQFFCLKEGNCSSMVKETQSTKVPKSRYRCKACWLKSCMQNFSVSTTLRNKLLKYVPRLDRPPHKPIIDENVALSNVVDSTPGVSNVNPEAAEVELKVVESGLKSSIKGTRMPKQPC